MAEKHPLDSANALPSISVFVSILIPRHSIVVGALAFRSSDRREIRC